MLKMARDKHWWLSFADASKPKGQQFLGAIIIEATDFSAAIGKTHLFKINPGGEVRIIEIPDSMAQRVRPIKNRLLSRKELAVHFDDLVEIASETVERMRSL